MLGILGDNTDGTAGIDITDIGNTIAGIGNAVTGVLNAAHGGGNGGGGGAATTQVQPNPANTGTAKVFGTTIPKWLEYAAIIGAVGAVFVVGLHVTKKRK